MKLVDESANAPLEVPIRKSSRAEKERTTSEGSDGAPGHPARNRTTSDGDSKDHKDVKDESKQRKESIFRRGLRQLSMGDSKA